MIFENGPVRPEMHILVHANVDCARCEIECCPLCLDTHVVYSIMKTPIPWKIARKSFHCLNIMEGSTGYPCMLNLGS